MIKVRAVFEKRGRAKYISHLDMNRCMQRCFKRADVPVWYTEGFNPHIYINFALALSLGFESGCEIMDFNITEKMPFDIMRDRLNKAMPEGIVIKLLYIPRTKHTDIAFSDFKIVFSGDVREMLTGFLSQDKIITIKKTKRGEKEVDLKPDTELAESSFSDGNTSVTLRLPAGQQKNINPTLVTDLFLAYCQGGTEILSVERTRILDAAKEDFQ